MPEYECHHRPTGSFCGECGAGPFNGFVVTITAAFTPH